MLSLNTPRLTLARILDELTPKELEAIGPDALEVEALSLASQSPRARKNWEAYFRSSPLERILTVPSVWLSKSPPEIQAERWEVLSEWKEHWGCSRLHLLVTRTDWDPASFKTTLPHDITWEAPRGLGSADLGARPAVVDPFHLYGHSQESRLPRALPPGEARPGLYWKIHGWHPARWIRRYSEEALKELWYLARDSQATHVCLAHSQRVAQLGELRAVRDSGFQ
jgi:hypothetical protein